MVLPILTIFIIIIILCGIIWLQIVLSKKVNKWYGRILPIVTLIFSLSVGAGYYYFAMRELDSFHLETVINSLLYLLVTNIPTVILWVIYVTCREKNKKNRELEKMKIEDL